MGKRDGHLSLVLGLEPKGVAGCLCGVVIDDYGLTDEQIVRDFAVLPPREAPLPPEVVDALPAMEAFAKREKLQFAFARWPNGVESLLCFEQHLQYPRPKQLIRAYKNAYAARAFVTSTDTTKLGAR